MRITDSLFYFNTKNNYQKSMKKLYDVNSQISTGSKIQNSFEDSGVYVDTMRLNYEVSTLEQVKKVSSKAQTFANNTDATMNQFNDTLVKFKSKLIQAANATNSQTSLSAIANDLQAMRDHMVSIANTSINGQFLFSGSALNVKPINRDGTYNGNGDNLNASIGSDVKLPYNIDGKSLFLGKDSDYQKIVSTNVQMLNQSKLHPDVMVVNSGVTAGKKVYLNSNDTIRDLVGDFDNNSTNDPNSMFYISGRKPDGKTFSSKIEMGSSEKVSVLLDKIGQKFGNTSTNKVVDVKMNGYGQIEVKDLKAGNQLLDMNIFGAVDRSASAGSAGNADATTVDILMKEKNVQIIEFQKSNFKSTNTASSISSRQDIFTPGRFTLGAPMLKTDGTPVDTSTALQDFMGTDINTIDFSGKDNSGTIKNDTLSVSNTTTVQELLDKVQTVYGLSVRLENGQIYLSGGDNTDFTSNKLDAKLTGTDSVGVAEVQSLDIKTSSTGGSVKVAGVTVSTANADSPTTVATKIVNAITTAGLPHTDGNGNSITAINSKGGKVFFTYDVANGDVANVDIASNTTGSILGSVITETQYAPSRVLNVFNTFDGMNYERRGFEKSGNILTSNIPQIVKKTNTIATNSTKLSEVSGIVPFVDTSLEFNFTDINGKMGKGKINLFNAGATFQVDFDHSGTFEPNETIPLYNADGTTQTKGKDVTYKQLTDVLALALSNTHPVDLDKLDSNGNFVSLPDGNIFPEYEKALISAKSIVHVGLDDKGRLNVHDKQQTATKMELSLFDSRSNSFALSNDTAAFAFMANDAVSIQKPSVDFFQELDGIIKSVRDGNLSMNADFSNPRNLGIQNSITTINHLSDHITKMHTKIGSYSNALQSASDRADFLTINVKTVRSKIADVDMAEAYMNFTQLSNNYQAMLSTISKINSMSLLKYM